MARFDNVEDVETFHQYVNRRVGQTSIPRMVHEEAKNKGITKTCKKKKTDNICDTHIDGA